MAWWDELFQPMPTGNLVGDTLGAINGSSVAEARSPETGSFDSNKIKAVVPEEYRAGVAPYIDTLAGLSNQKQQALMEAYKKPESTWLQGIGRALSAASVPVAYAQGNLAYGNGMLGRTEQDLYNRRSERYQDQLAQAKAGGAEALYNGIGTSAVDYISKRNETKRAFKLQATKILAAARRTGDPSIIADAEKQVADLAAAQGIEADGVMPKSALSPAAAAGPAMVGGDAQPSGVPGLSVTPPTGGPAPTPGTEGTGLPGGLPTPQQPAPRITPPAPQASTTAADPLALAKRKRGQAAVALAAGSKADADALIKEAETLEEPYQKGKIKLAEKQSELAVKRVEEQPQDIARLEKATTDTNNMVETIDQLVGLDKDNKPVLSTGASKNVGGPYDTYFPNMPGGEAANAWAKIGQIKNQLSFMAMQSLREMSKTGGGAGNMTEKEWPRFEAQIAALDPNMSDEEFASQLHKIKTTILKFRDDAYRRYGQTHGVNVDKYLSAAKQRVSTGAKDKQDTQRVSTEALSGSKPGTTLRGSDGWTYEKDDTGRWQKKSQHDTTWNEEY